MGVTVTVTVLGATGSVGLQTLSLLQRIQKQKSQTNQPQAVQVEALVAQSSVKTLAYWARTLGAKFVALADPSKEQSLRTALKGSGIAMGVGKEAVLAAARRPCDLSISAISGFAGLAPTLCALEGAKILGLANKESVVCAGSLLMETAARKGVEIFPLDSEHHGLSRLLQGRESSEIARIGITASGGPFYQATQAQMRQATPEQAMRHPVWRMGAKITVDSATLMNKGLEILEAETLFGIPERKIDVLIHPEANLHAWVVLPSGEILTHISPPDMRIPLAACLSRAGLGGENLFSEQDSGQDSGKATGQDSGKEHASLESFPPFRFFPPDDARFPSLSLARLAARAGGSTPIVFNAANEAAVDAFLQRKIPLPEIFSWVEEALAKWIVPPASSLEEITNLHKAVLEDFSTRKSSLRN